MNKISYKKLYEELMLNISKIVKTAINESEQELNLNNNDIVIYSTKWYEDELTDEEYKDIEYRNIDVQEYMEGLLEIDKEDMLQLFKNIIGNFIVITNINTWNNSNIAIRIFDDASMEDIYKLLTEQRDTLDIEVHYILDGIKHFLIHRYHHDNCNTYNIYMINNSFDIEEIEEYIDAMTEYKYELTLKNTTKLLTDKKYITDINIEDY